MVARIIEKAFHFVQIRLAHKDFNELKKIAVETGDIYVSALGKRLMLNYLEALLPAEKRKSK